MGPGGRGVSIAGPGSWDAAAGALAPPLEAVTSPAAAGACAVVDAFFAALPVAALVLEAELLAGVVLDAGAETFAAAGFSVLAADLAAFFVVLPAAAVVFLATFFWSVFVATFFATFLAARFAAALMPPRAEPRASRSGLRAVSFAIFSSVIAVLPVVDRMLPRRIGTLSGRARAAAPSMRYDSSIIAPAK